MTKTWAEKAKERFERKPTPEQIKLAVDIFCKEIPVKNKSQLLTVVLRMYGYHSCTPAPTK